MAVEVTYQYYTDQYHGSAVAEDDWAHAALVASARLGRLKLMATVTPTGDASECESMAICAMAEQVALWEASTTAGGGVASERVGSVSESYMGAAQTMPEGLETALMKAIKPWLHVCLVAR